MVGSISIVDGFHCSEIILLCLGEFALSGKQPGRIHLERRKDRVIRQVTFVHNGQCIVESGLCLAETTLLLVN